MIMAGGDGLRMSRSGGHEPKVLMPVAGVPLLMRALWQLVRHDFDAVTVVVPAAADAVKAFARTSLMDEAHALGCTLRVREEAEPLGNFGAVQWLAEGSGAAAVVFADNITALDLRDIAAAHQQSDAAMTIATHRQPFVMPFGEVRTANDRVTGYVEKPETMFTVCSAIAIVGPASIRAIAPGERLGISDLVNRLVARGDVVLAYPHDAPWIDVNDLGQLERAEAMIAEHPKLFARPIGGVVPTVDPAEAWPA